jgi:hypothetical protein
LLFELTNQFERAVRDTVNEARVVPEGHSDLEVEWVFFGDTVSCLKWLASRFWWELLVAAFNEDSLCVAAGSWNHKELKRVIARWIEFRFSECHDAFDGDVVGVCHSELQIDVVDPHIVSLSEEGVGKGSSWGVVGYLNQDAVLASESDFAGIKVVGGSDDGGMKTVFEVGSGNDGVVSR